MNCDTQSRSLVLLLAVSVFIGFVFLVGVNTCGGNASAQISGKVHSLAFARWQVNVERQDAFIKAWARRVQKTRHEKDRQKGSCLLLRSKNNSSEFLEVNRVGTFAAPDDIQITPGLAVLRSQEVFEELSDRLERSSWKTRMIRIYHLRVKPGQESAFVRTWLKVNKAIGAKVRGARGGLLLRDRENRSMFVEVVRWDTHQDWQAFVTGPAVDPEGFSEIFSMMTVTSAEEFEEIDIYDC